MRVALILVSALVFLGAMVLIEHAAERGAGRPATVSGVVAGFSGACVIGLAVGALP